MSPRSRYLIGIDLGTTHTVVAFADCGGTLATSSLSDADSDASDEPSGASPAPPIQVFPIEQWVGQGELAEKPLLPSARYHLRPGEWSGAGVSSQADYDQEAPALIGSYALELGARNPERLVTSAKSWLCHGAVDREAPILPWGAPESVFKTSPVDASASYLEFLRQAWDRAHPAFPMASQEVLLTVPASFDESARAFTLQAAEKAGLPPVRLVEEPLAAFYNWLDQFRLAQGADRTRSDADTHPTDASSPPEDLNQALSEHRLALVVDCGGGTTDLSLIRLELRESGPRLTRIAVGEHLLLGGDNMDLALAKAVEGKLSGSGDLTHGQLAELVQASRIAKEQLLGDDANDTVRVSILGSGSKLIGSGRTAQVSRELCTSTIVDGFFPKVAAGTEPQKRRGAVMALGLPYVNDPAITKHIASFLRQHQRLSRISLGDRSPDSAALPVPDAVLVNGGVFRSGVLRERLLDALGAWRGSPPTLLSGSDPERAVARGAVAYGLARRGLGLRIGGGSPRSYFLVLESGDDAIKRGVCVLPKGSEEGEQRELKDRQFTLKVGEPVKFSVVSAVQDVFHFETGQLVDLEGEMFHPLPPLAAVIDQGDQQMGERIPVRLSAGLTEVGTLELSLLHPKGRWKLSFELRGSQRKAGPGLSEGPIGKLHPRFEEATARIQTVFGKSKQGVADKSIKSLRSDLERILSSREQWDTPLLRELFGALLAGAKRRRRSASHERVWFNLAGYTLRPGYGYPLDDWRIEQLFALFEQGVQFMPETQNQAEWWIMWRRIAGGLGEAQQKQIFDVLSWYLMPKDKGRGSERRRPKGPKWQGYPQMVRLVGSLERLDPAIKEQAGGWLIARLNKGTDAPESWWAVGRLGARVPFYGSAHQVVSVDTATEWLGACLRQNWTTHPDAALAATLLARRSGDRSRDLAEGDSAQVAARLREVKAPPSWVNMVTEVAELAPSDQGRMLGDSLPLGLKLIE